MPKVRVEFFGIPRERAGVAALEVEVGRTTLAEVLAEVARLRPEFGQRCLDNGCLARGLTANINGRYFTSNVETELTDGDSLLILSADVGG